MSAQILDGKALAQHFEEEMRRRVDALKAKADGRTPILATLLVGADPASATYVKMKGNACRRVGMDSRAIELPEDTTTEQLLAQIDELNNNPDVHGILLQHPVPEQIDERRCFDAISLEKDVDGVTCLGFGRMAMGEPAYGCATPKGIMRILEHYQIPLEGKHAVVVGRSAILGKPMALMLLGVLLFHSVIAKPFYIPSASMVPNLMVGDRLVVSKYPYGWNWSSLSFHPLSRADWRIAPATPEYGDIVVLMPPEGTEPMTEYIKRVVALPGDRIALVDGRIILNGEEVPREMVPAVQLPADNPNIWTKVSCPERLTQQAPDYSDVVPFARTLVEKFPDRVLWGTDWPHPNMKSHVPDDGKLVDVIPHIAPTAALQQALLIDNPMRLYWQK